MKKFIKGLVVVGATVPVIASAQTTVDAAVTSALSTGASSANTYLIAAIAIPVAFFVFKLGKRALSRA